MGSIICLNGLTLNLGSLVESHKVDFLNRDFFNYLGENFVSEYEGLLRRHNFSYVVGKGENQIGLGCKHLNKDLGGLMASKVSGFLELGSGPINYEREVLSKTQISTTLCALANSVALNYQGLDNLFVKFKNIRPLFNRRFFVDSLNPSLGVYGSGGDNINSYVICNVNGPTREFFKDINHPLDDVIYTRRVLNTKN